MSDTSSPIRMSGEFDGFLDPNFTADISNKMRVPKRICVNGEVDDDFVNPATWPRTNGATNKVEMNVPDRILVVGQEQHIGTKAPPRELQLENAVMPQLPDMNIVRVQTPPRVLTLEEHMFPTADDKMKRRVFPDEDSINSAIPPMDRSLTIPDASSPMIPSSDLVAADELQLVRRQVSTLNRRVMALELDAQQRQQKDLIVYTLGLAYILFKTLLWLTRS